MRHNRAVCTRHIRGFGVSFLMRMTCLGVLLLSPFLMGGQPTGKLIYVDSFATDVAKNGTSWVDAFTDLQSALAEARPGDEIRVAQGVYRPAGPNSAGENAVFLLKGANGAKIKGGYRGGRVNPNDTNSPDYRDILLYPTILSGDLRGDDEFGNTGENSHHVIDSSGTNESTELDGFTITGGNANDPLKWENQVGAGIYNIGGNLTIRDCTFRKNSALDSGGAMYNKPSYSSDGQTLVPCAPKLIRCTFIENSAMCGGGVANRNSNTTLSYCTFTRNSGIHGAGLYNCDSHSTLLGCGFIANQASYGGALCNYNGGIELASCVFNGNLAMLGGGILNYQSQMKVINCTVSCNSADLYGGGIFCMADSDIPVTVANSILWGNVAGSGSQIYAHDCGVAITSSDVQGGSTDNGNIAADPLLIHHPDPGADGKWGTADDDYGDLRLQSGSPCIDTGNSALLPDMKSDIAGNPRISDGNGDDQPAVDMGAYELGQGEIRYVYLQFPNGGEILRGTSITEIKWNSKGIDRVLLNYSTDNGETWTSIATVPNHDSYLWHLPDMTSNQCLIQLVDAGNPKQSDVSHSTFAIINEVVPEIRITRPVAGELLRADEPYSID